jgi:formiminoglutamate deiminase
MNPDQAETIAAWAYVEMLESGFTRVGEFHYLHHAPDGAAYDNPAEMAGRIAAAAGQTGIGLTLLPVFYRHGGFGGTPSEPAQRRFVSTMDGYAALLERCRSLPVRLGVAPHSLRAVAPEQLAEMAALTGGPVHIHVAEQQREVADCLAWSGARPVRFLLDHAPVDRRWCLIHATHVAQAEIDSIARIGAVVGLCPVTEANLGDGVMPVAALAAAGGGFGVGTDSNVRIGLADELCLLEYAQRLTGQARNILSAGGSTGGALFRAALAGGAQAAGLGTAGLQVGAAADIVSLRADHAAVVGRSGDALLDAWIFAARPGLIDSVWAAGRQVVSGGAHVAGPSIIARFRAVMARLLGA